jgi:hypothetical protein
LRITERHCYKVFFKLDKHYKKVCVRKRSQGFCVVRTQTFVLDNLKNTLINTNLCGISAFFVENSKISHKFVSINVFSNDPTQNPCDRFQKQGLCCRNTNFLRVRGKFEFDSFKKCPKTVKQSSFQFYKQSKIPFKNLTKLMSTIFEPFTLYDHHLFKSMTFNQLVL